MRSLYKKFYILMVVVVVATMIGLNVQYNHSRDQVHDNARQIAEVSVSVLKEEIEGWLSQRAQVIEDVADLIGMNRWDQEASLAYMKVLLQKNPAFASIYFGSKDNVMINASGWVPPPEFDLRTRPWYVTGNSITHTETFVNASKDDLIVTISKPVYTSAGELLGVIAGDVSVRTIIKLVQEKKFGRNGFSFLVDGNNKMLAHPDYQYDPNAGAPALNGEYLNFAELAKTSSPGVIQYSLQGKGGFVAFQKIDNTKWMLGSFISLEDLSNRGEQMTRGFVLALAVSGVILGVLFLLLAKFVIHPLVRLNESVKQIDMEKNPTYRVPVSGSDEVALVSRTINHILNRAGLFLAAREQTAEALEENGKFLNSLLDAIPVPVFYKDSQGLYIGTNQAFERFYGKTRQELAGKSVFDAAPPELARIYHDKDLELLWNQGTQIYETQVKDAQGIDHDVVFHKAAFIGVDGNVRGLIGAILDITERKNAEEALRVSRARYHALVDQSSEALAVVDIEKKEVIEINRKFTELLGYSLPEDAPLLVNQFVVETEKNLAHRYNVTLKQHRFLPVESQVLRHKNGANIYVERAGTIINIDGREYLLANNRDMTAERRRQRDLARDFEFARRVQSELLPKVPDSQSVSIRTLYYPSNVVSGDSYHMEWLNNETLLRGFLVDVSGHGLATAIQTSSIMVLLREVMATKLPLLGQMQWINSHAVKYFVEGTYAAMLGFELDLQARELRYVGAGITQFYANSNKISTPGMFVGVWENAEFTQGKITIAAGGVLCFLTDGFTDVFEQPNNSNIAARDSTNFDDHVAALEQLAVKGKLLDDATGICLQIRELS